MEERLFQIARPACKLHPWFAELVNRQPAHDRTIRFMNDGRQRFDASHMRFLPGAARDTNTHARNRARSPARPRQMRCHAVMPARKKRRRITHRAISPLCALREAPRCDCMISDVRRGGGVRGPLRRVQLARRRARTVKSTNTTDRLQKESVTPSRTFPRFRGSE